MKKIFFIVFLSIGLSGCAPIMPVLCKSKEITLKEIEDRKVNSYRRSESFNVERSETKKVQIGMTSKELIETLGAPQKVFKREGGDEYVYYTGNFRMFLIGFLIIGREQYKFIFEEDKLIGISFYSSTTWPKDFCK